jgi:hypothetical protein
MFVEFLKFIFQQAGSIVQKWSIMVEVDRKLKGGLRAMSEELNQEILDELKKINQKLDTIDQQRGISTPLKFIAVIIGVTIIGPLIMVLIGIIGRFFK